MKIAFIGPDRTGKSNIAAALSEKLDIPVFKNSGEWCTELSSEDYFLNLLRFGGPFLMDFMVQTDVSVILDRFYPCELVYAKAFGRRTDEDVIARMDEQFASTRGRLVFCLRKDYSGLKDDVYPDDLSQAKLEEIGALYEKFHESTACESHLIYTDDMDLDRQLDDILNFLQNVENKMGVLIQSND